VRHDRGFDLGGRDRLAPGADDLLAAPHDRDVPLVVELGEVTGAVPATIEGGGRLVGQLEVPRHGAVGRQEQLTAVEARPYARDRHTDAPRLAEQVVVAER